MLALLWVDHLITLALLAKYVSELGCSIGEKLLKPTKIYVNAFFAIKGKVKIKDMAHITSGGIPGNLPRIFQKNISAKIDKSSWDIPPIFKFIEKIGRIDKKKCIIQHIVLKPHIANLNGRGEHLEHPIVIFYV